MARHLHTPSPTANAQDVTVTHTPGPWSMGQTGCYETALVSPNAVVAFAAWDGGSGCHLEIKNAADARLIAAAPDQHDVALELDKWSLVILSAVRRDAPSDHDAIVALIKANRAAIAKATAA